jgi:hypothetical protein
MEHQNFASYKPGTFVVDLGQVEPAVKFFESKDMPAMVHEYCHYIQDISTISAIMGFSLWMRDVVNLTKVFSDGDGKTIAIPLEKDQFGENISKFRKYYSLYCGNPDDIFEIDYSLNSFVQHHFSTTEINLSGEKRVFGVNEIEFSNRPQKIFFGLIALQEMHAYYAQKLAESKSGDVVLSIYADSLASYPYKFGDHIFDIYNIQIDLPTKFVLIDLCLDTVQATSVFWKVLEKLRGLTVTFFGPDSTDLISVVKGCRAECSYSTNDALENILPDIKNWAEADGRDDLRSALSWYVRMIEGVYYFKSIGEIAPTFFSLPFIMPWKDFAQFFQIYPFPAYFKTATLLGNVASDGNEDDNVAFKGSFEAASTFWVHRVLYDLLTVENVEQLKKRAHCPLFEGCTIKAQLDEEYICRTAPWEIVKGKTQAPCLYGLAAHSFGLWQNSLDFKI